MKRHRFVAPIGAGGLVSVWLLVAAEPSAAQLPLEPPKESGQSVIAAYEGWFKNADGTYTLLVGYYNRNRKQTMEIPVGPNNRFEPGDPDRGQPTYFQPLRHWGVFTITVPADFPGKKLIWKLVANNTPTEVPLHLDPLWEVSPYSDAALGNTPPVVRFEPDGTEITGPPLRVGAFFDSNLSTPTTLTVWASDDGLVDEYRRDWKSPPLSVSWSKFRGPGEATFGNPVPEIDESSGKATTTATFSEPGEYILRLQANDKSGNGGSGAQCCWTNVHVKVTVHAGPVSHYNY